MDNPRILQARYDREGTILSATILPARTPRGSKNVQPMQTGVVADSSTGQVAAEFEVPGEFGHLELHELAEQLRVDVKSDRPRLEWRGRAPQDC